MRIFWGHPNTFFPALGGGVHIMKIHHTGHLQSVHFMCFHSIKVFL